MRRIVALISLTLCAACSQQQASDQVTVTTDPPLSICDIAAVSAKYDGRLLKLRARYRLYAHGMMVFDPNCANINVQFKYADSYKDFESAMQKLKDLTVDDAYRPLDVVFYGQFLVAKPGQCFGTYCYGYMFEATKLETATLTK